MGGPVRFKDLSGQTFERLTVLEFAGLSCGNATWKCQCTCGTIVVVRGDRLRRGTTKSCGCYRGDCRRTHDGSKTRLYKVWLAMKQRCLNPNHESYERYGQRGITIDKRWVESFENFYNDVGDPPSDKHSLERKDNDGPYSPANCVWATSIEQQNNTRRNRVIEHDGRKLTVIQWARELGIPASTISRRFHRGHPIDKVLSKQRI